MSNRTRHKGDLAKGNITFKIEVSLSGLELVDILTEGLASGELPDTILTAYLHKWIKKKIIEKANLIKETKQYPKAYREKALELFYKHLK